MVALRGILFGSLKCFSFLKKFFSNIEKLGYLSKSSRFWLGPEPRLDAESSLDLNPAASLDGHICPGHCSTHRSSCLPDTKAEH